MDITNEELAAVEVAEYDDDCLVYQIWATDESVEETSMDNLASQDEIYRVNVVGEVDNLEEYGENFEAEVSVRHLEDGFYEWLPDTNGDAEEVEAYVFGYDESDPRDGDRPEVAAELSPYSDPELEDKLSAAFTGVPVRDL